MKAVQHLTLASLLAFGAAFANVAIAEDISPAKPAASDQMTSQQELIDIFFAAARTGNQEVINEFLKHGFPVDVRNVDCDANAQKSGQKTAAEFAQVIGQEKQLRQIIASLEKDSATDMK